MLLADTMAWVFGILGLMCALPGLWLLCRGLWPDAVAHTTTDCSKGLLIPLLVGIPIAVALVVTVGIVSKSPAPWNGILTIGAISAVVFFASTGIAGLATSIGQKLPSPADSDRPWKATIRGGIVLELAYLVPFLGWFVILPLSLLIGAGSALRAVIASFRNRSKSKTPTATTTNQIDNGTLGASA